MSKTAATTLNRELPTSSPMAAMGVRRWCSLIAEQILRLPLIAMATVTVCVAYAGVLLDQGWIPHDEGQLGLTAVRILNGDLPHRDFVDPYTGGLGFFNAAAFWCFGTSSMVMRSSLLPFFGLFCAAMYWLSSRVFGTATAVLVTMLGAALTLPIYPAGMPSWYNLFFAVGGVAALVRFREVEDRRWLFVAGLCGGLSITFKIVGLYFVVAALAFLLYCSRNRHAHTESRPGVLCIGLTCLLAVCGGAGFLLARTDSLVLDIVHFGIPVLCLAVALIVNEWRVGPVDWADRFSWLATNSGILLLGVAAPIVLLLIPYLWTGSVDEWLHGVFILPVRRLSGAAKPFAHPWHVLVAALPLTAVTLVGWLPNESMRRAVFVLTGVLGAQFATSMLAANQTVLYVGVRHAIPLLVSAATLSLLLLQFRSKHCDARRCEELFLMLAAAGFISLVQYPYSGDFYFFYAAPFGLLLAIYTVRIEPRPPTFLAHLVLCLVLVFVVGRLHLPNPAVAGGIAVAIEPTRRLPLERSPLIVRDSQARLYDDLIDAIRLRSPEGSYIYAGPDCPEVYFLADRRNPLRTSYGLFGGDGKDEAKNLLEKLERYDIRVVVVNLRSEFSDELPPGVGELIRNRFENRREFRGGDGNNEQAFTMFWRD